MYDADAIEAEMESLADQAERDLQGLRNQVGNRDAERGYDEVLARVFVYGHLRRRHFLQSRESLVDELRWMLASSSLAAPIRARSAAAFETHRDALLAGLMARFSR